MATVQGAEFVGFNLFSYYLHYPYARLLLLLRLIYSSITSGSHGPINVFSHCNLAYLALLTYCLFRMSQLL